MPPTIVQIVSTCAIITTIGHMFTGIPVCLQVKKQGNVGEISGFPFIMGLLVASFWLRYGLLRADNSLVAVNSAGVLFQIFYNSFFLYYSKPKTPQAAKLCTVLLLIAIMITCVHFFPNVTYFGMISTALTFVNFGAPLAGLGVVLKRKEVSTLPFAMCIFTFLVTAQWTLYGLLSADYFITTTSGVGMLISLAQLSLFVIFPRRADEKSALRRLANRFKRVKTSEKDAEVN